MNDVSTSQFSAQQTFAQDNPHTLNRGDNAVETAFTYRAAELKDVEKEILLAVNERLYAQGLLTAELYGKAKDIIIKEMR